MEKIVDISTGVYKETIVRCKDCKHYSEMWGCTRHYDTHLVTDPDDFCRLGEERK